MPSFALKAETTENPLLSSKDSSNTKLVFESSIISIFLPSIAGPVKILCKYPKNACNR
jgi:hypothetical protein